MAHSQTAILTSLLILGSLTANVFAGEDQRRQIPLPPSIPKVEKSPTAGLPPRAPKIWDTSVVETQRELQDILRIHRTLQVQQQSQLREIQRITEQARIHQKILKDLAAGKEALGIKSNVKTVEETIRLQKIALIEKEARKNRAHLKRLQRRTAQEKKSAPTKAFNIEKLPFSSQKISPQKKKK